MAREKNGQSAQDAESPQDHSLMSPVHAKLGGHLKAMFAETVEEPVPERFITLLQELEAKEKRR